MLERLGSRKYILPLIGVLLIACVFSTMMYPMLAASPKNIPVAIVSLDEGATTPAGDVNMGDVLVEKITSATTGTDDPVLAWTQLNKAPDNVDDYYAVLVVPADFTASQAAAQAGRGTADDLQITINQAKNPTVATSVETMMKTMMSASGVGATITYANPVPAELASAAYSQMVTIMLTFVLSLFSSILLYVTMRPKKTATRPERVRAFCVQVAYAAVLSCLVGLIVPFVLKVIVGLAIPFVTLWLFLWVCSFAIITLLVGCLDLALGLGIAVALCCFLGMSAGSLPYEFLPHFWQDWVYPWAPQHYIGTGVRGILYSGSGAFNSKTAVMTIYVGVGLVAGLLALLKKGKTPVAVA